MSNPVLLVVSVAVRWALDVLAELVNLTGIAALLRFPLPDLEDMEP